MQEGDFKAHRANGKDDLESRLAAYYGPVLQEQPLPQAEWLRLRAKLGYRHTTKSRHGRRMLLHRNARSNRMPAYIQNTFSRMVYETHMQGDTPDLRCSFKNTVRVPRVHTSFIGKRKIWLTLPPHGVGAMETAMLEVLLCGTQVEAESERLTLVR